MTDHNKRLASDAKQIKRTFMSTLTIHILSAIFLLGVAFYVGYATLKYFGIAG